MSPAFYSIFTLITQIRLLNGTEIFKNSDRKIIIFGDFDKEKNIFFITLLVFFPKLSDHPKSIKKCN